MQFFDVNAYLGRGMLRQQVAATTVEGYFEQTVDTDISRAVAWHIAQRDGGSNPGNALLSEAIAGDDRVFGCWTIVPTQTDRDVMTPDFFARMQTERVVALRAFPDMHRYILNRAVFGDFLDEVATRRIPFLVSPRFGMDWPAIHRLLADYPTLTCVLCDVGTWGQDRNTWPLLDCYPNTFIESSMLSLEAGGLEAAVRAYGAERILFGTGFPYHSPYGAVLDLLHADISDDDKAKIAAGNLTELLGKGVLA